MRGFRDFGIGGFRNAGLGWRTVLTGLAAVACLVGTDAAAGRCTAAPGGPRAVVALAEPAGACMGTTRVSHPVGGVWMACLGPCFCPTPMIWGYWERQWQAWPGDRYRQDVVFPQSIGLELLAAPRGELPKPLPREVYAKQKTKAERDREAGESGGMSVQVREGAPVEPVETPQPFDLMPNE